MFIAKSIHCQLIIKVNHLSCLMFSYSIAMRWRMVLVLHQQRVLFLVYLTLGTPTSEWLCYLLYNHLVLQLRPSEPAKKQIALALLLSVLQKLENKLLVPCFSSHDCRPIQLGTSNFYDGIRLHQHLAAVWIAPYGVVVYFACLSIPRA